MIVSNEPGSRPKRTEKHRQVSDARRRARVAADLYEMSRWADSHWRPISLHKAAMIVRTSPQTLRREMECRSGVSS